MQFRINIFILLSALLITTLGLVVLYSTTPSEAYDQLRFVIIGLVAYFTISQIDNKILKSRSTAIFLICIVVNILPIIIGPEIRGSRRWLVFAGINFQVSETLKIGLPLILSAAITRQKYIANKISTIYFLLALLSLCIVFLQPDLGTSVLLSLILFFYFLISNFSFKKKIIVLILSILSFIPMWFLLKDYQKQRIEGYLNFTEDILGKNYNSIQATIAVGSGMIFGSGYGMGSQSHLRFLPEYHTDFIFASFAEEWGLFFCLVLLLLYCFLFFQIFVKAKNSKNMYGSLVCIGMFFYLFFQTFINIGMNLGILPVTGIPLPFMSYGGSSLITNFIALGIVSGTNEIGS